MDDLSVKIFTDALSKGNQKIYHIRIMVVGHYGVGKTTFSIGLLNDDSIKYKKGSTEGIDIYVGKCRIDNSTGEWVLKEEAGGRSKAICKTLIHQGSVEKYQEEKKRKEAVKEEIKISWMAWFFSLFFSLFSFWIFSRFLQDGSNYGKMKDKVPVEVEKICTSDDKRKPEEDDEEISEEDGEENLSGSKDNKLASKLLQGAIKYSSKMSKDEIEKEYTDVEVWDFGGQEIFYASHQTFLSSRCIYTLVFDASKSLDDIVEEGNIGANQRNFMRAIEYIEFWVNTIILYAKGKDEGYPKIILIATHLDKVKEHRKEEEVDKMFKRIINRFKDSPAEKHLIINPKFCLDASKLDHEIYTLLRHTIYQTASKYSSYGEERPTSWIPLESALNEQRDNGKCKIIRTAKIFKINKKLSNEFEKLSEDDIITFLEFKHSLGDFLYFREDSLKDHVILRPKWVIDAFCSIITHSTFCRTNEVKNQVYQQLTHNGFVDDRLLQKLWEMEEFKEFGSHESHLLKLMERLDLVVRPKAFDDEEEKKSEKFYFIPCMLKKDVNVKYIEVLEKKDAVGIVFKHKGKFLPNALYFRLVGSCIKMWPILKEKGKPVMFTALTGFSVDESHNMFLKHLENSILVVIQCNQCERLSSALCEGIRCFMEASLKRLVEAYDCSSVYQLSGCSEVFLTAIPCCIHHIECQHELEQLKQNRTFNCKHLACAKKDSIFPFSGQKTQTRKQDDCQYDCKGVDISIKDKMISDQHLSRVARRISTDHLTLLARFLFYADDDRAWNAIKTSTYFSEDTDKMCRVLLKWQKQYFGTYGTIEKELQEFGSDIQDNCIGHLLCKALRVDRLYENDPVYDFVTKHQFRKLSSRLLSALAVRLTEMDVYQLALELGVPSWKLDKMRDHSSYLQRSEEMLAYWKNNFPCKPSPIRVLSVALDEVGIYNMPLREILENNAT